MVGTHDIPSMGIDAEHRLWDISGPNINGIWRYLGHQHRGAKRRYVGKRGKCEIVWCTYWSIGRDREETLAQEL